VPAREPEEKTGILWKSLPGNRVQCDLCLRRCVIPQGERGYCFVRKNVEGRLVTEAYGRVSAINMDPIEKKPLFHFLPSTDSLSISTVSCNFRCKFCQNWDISYFSEIRGIEIAPSEIAEAAFSHGAASISYTYNEPTIFMEYALDTAKEAKKRGLKNVFVTNGYMTPEAVDAAKGFIDAMTVGIKGSLKPDFYRKMMVVPNSEDIKGTLAAIKEAGIHLEVTDLLVTKYGDDLASVAALSKWIAENLSPDVPFHLLRFFPDAQLLDLPPTDVDLLRKARQTAISSGLRYVYMGNVPGEGENTYCPVCGNLLIERKGFSSLVVGLTQDSKCKRCGAQIPVLLKEQKGTEKRRQHKRALCKIPIYLEQTALCWSSSRR